MQDGTIWSCARPPTRKAVFPGGCNKRLRLLLCEQTALQHTTNHLPCIHDSALCSCYKDHHVHDTPRHACRSGNLVERPPSWASGQAEGSGLQEWLQAALTALKMSCRRCTLACAPLPGTHVSHRQAHAAILVVTVPRYQMLPHCRLCCWQMRDSRRADPTKTDAYGLRQSCHRKIHLRHGQNCVPA
jgi:hypothetical protein